MGFSLGAGIPAITVFLQGILSFFSPCVLPLVPLYVSYLAGGAKTVAPDGTIQYPRKRVLVNTVCFVLGVSATFFLLGLGFTALGRFFSDNRLLFARISGVIMVFFGLYQLGFFGREGALEREHRLPFRLNRWAMNPAVAFILGFTFSFAWTPCVGPALGSVLLMASSAGSAGSGFLLIGVYTLGFVIPFLAVGLFTGGVLGFFKRHQKVVKYTVKVGAVLLILMGIMTFTGYMNSVTGYLSSVGSGLPPSTGQTVPPAKESTAPEAVPTREPVPAPDFTLVDQNGETHTLSDYQGKTVFLNFWATWCSPCQREMPHIQSLYEAYEKNEGDLVVLAVANPKTEEQPRNADKDQATVEQFLTDREFTFPVAMDLTGDVFAAFGVRGYPTTFMIDKDGNVFGYVSGGLSYDMMENIVQQTMTAVPAQ